jgi:acyl-coenzyme A thioesterase PaaI-like protein
MLIGEAEVVKDGRATSFYKVRITDELGTKIAEVSTNGYKLPARS